MKNVLLMLSILLILTPACGDMLDDELSDEETISANFEVRNTDIRNNDDERASQAFIGYSLIDLERVRNKIYQTCQLTENENNLILSLFTQYRRIGRNATYEVMRNQREIILSRIKTLGGNANKKRCAN